MALNLELRHRWLRRTLSLLSKRQLGKLSLFATFSFITAFIVTKNSPIDEVSQFHLGRLTGPLAYNDPELIELVRQHFLYPPSSSSYNLIRGRNGMEDLHYNKYVHEYAYMFCQKAIQEIFKDVKSGFFVEAGAVDGEYLSNSLPLELENDWTGLLVEVDKNMFSELLTKNRRVWASPSCLATAAYPHRDVLIRYSSQHNSNIFDRRAASAHASLFSISNGIALDKSEPGHRIYEASQCLPLASLLLGIGIYHVNLVSLDVEGAESGILENFPWDDITVDVWVVEHVQTDSKPTHFKTSKDKASLLNTSTENDRKTIDVPFKGSTVNGKPSMDQHFIDLFRRQGYELYKFSEDLFIPNYVFILKTSKTFQRLKSDIDTTLS